MIRFVLSVISVNLYNDQTRCFVDRMGKYFSSLLAEVLGVPAPYFYARDDTLADLILACGQLEKPAQRLLLDQLSKTQPAAKA